MRESAGSARAELQSLAAFAVAGKRHAPAAFPTIGSRIRPMNSLLMLPESTSPFMESTRNSAVTATHWGQAALVSDDVRSASGDSPLANGIDAKTYDSDDCEQSDGHRYAHLRYLLLFFLSHHRGCRLKILFRRYTWRG